MWSWFMFIAREPENKSWRTGTTKDEIFPLQQSQALITAPGEHRGSGNQARTMPIGQFGFWGLGRIFQMEKTDGWPQRKREKTKLMEMEILKSEKSWHFSRGNYMTSLLIDYHGSRILTFSKISFCCCLNIRALLIHSNFLLVPCSLTKGRQCKPSIKEEGGERCFISINWCECCEDLL